MSFVFLINGLSLFIIISFFPELLLISKIGLSKKERLNMNRIIITSGLGVLLATVGRFIWGENLIYEAIVSFSTSGILTIWFILVLCGYNYCVKELKWKKSIKYDKKDYFIK